MSVDVSQAWDRFIASDPACWSWEQPAAAYVEALKASVSQELGSYFREEDWPGILMSDWHQGRCAICGERDELVHDHDHRTALIRGKLCRSCNTLEGMRHGGIFAKYRERNPATICGVQERYWNPITMEYDEPEPALDRWKNNPMKGIGL